MLTTSGRADVPYFLLQPESMLMSMVQAASKSLLSESVVLLRWGEGRERGVFMVCAMARNYD